MISQVYVIGAPSDTIVKIGCSLNPKRRLLALRHDHTQFPAELDRSRLTLLSQQPGDLKLELRLHWHFADKRVIGEWYDLAGGDPVEQVSAAINHIQLTTPRQPDPPTGPTVRITVDGRLALTVEQAAARYQLDEVTIRSIIKRQAVEPAGLLDRKKKVYFAAVLDAVLKARPGRGSNRRTQPAGPV